MLVAIAMANKLARIVWAMLARNQDYRDQAERSAEADVLIGMPAM
ncbi:hypothetical protein [Shinella sp.]